MVGNETACVLSEYVTMDCLIRLPFIHLNPDLHATWLCRIHCTVVKWTELTCLKYLTIQTWRHLHSIKAEEISLPASCLDFIHSLLICPLFHFRTWERLWIWSAATQICKICSMWSPCFIYVGCSITCSVGFTKSYCSLDWRFDFP